MSKNDGHGAHACIPCPWLFVQKLMINCRRYKQALKLKFWDFVK